jgi:hypothetical protein
MADDTIAHQYNEIVIEWGEEARGFTDVAVEAAQADAAWKVAEARVIVREKRKDPRIAIDYVRALALVDETGPKPASAIYSDKLIAEAKLEGLKKKLQWNAARADNLRTQVVDERNRNSWESQRPSTDAQPQWGHQGPKEQASRERRDDSADRTFSAPTGETMMFATKEDAERYRLAQSAGAEVESGEIPDEAWAEAEKSAREASERAAAEAAAPEQRPPDTNTQPEPPKPAEGPTAPPSQLRGEIY